MTDDLTKAKQYMEPGALVPIDQETVTLLLNALRQALAEPSEKDKVDRDVFMYGQGFMKNDKHVPTSSISVVNLDGKKAVIQIRYVRWLWIHLDPNFDSWYINDKYMTEEEAEYFYQGARDFKKLDWSRQEFEK